MLKSQIDRSVFNDFVLYSGGARGADALFGVMAAKYGVGKQFHIRPFNNTTMAPSLKRGMANTPAFECPMDKLEEAHKALLELGVGNFNPNTIGGALQCRNYYQVVKSDLVLAIARINTDMKSVSGGTNTAVQCGIKMGKPVYVLNTIDCHWYVWNGEHFVKYDSIPKLTRRFTGVGTRDIENYQVKDKVSGAWITRPEYVGDKVRGWIEYQIDALFEFNYNILTQHS